MQIAHSDGGAVILSTSPYFADGTPYNLVDAYNQIVEAVAAEFPYVSIDDLYSVLDPGGTYASVVDGISARGADGVHITQAAVDNLIEPALNQIIANVAGRGLRRQRLGGPAAGPRIGGSCPQARAGPCVTNREPGPTPKPPLKAS